MFATGGYAHLHYLVHVYLDARLVLEVFIEEGRAVSQIHIVATISRHKPAAMDVSADLFELSRCPVGLVSSGVKSILDIGRLVRLFSLKPLITISD